MCASGLRRWLFVWAMSGWSGIDRCVTQIGVTRDGERSTQGPDVSLRHREEAGRIALPCCETEWMSRRSIRSIPFMAFMSSLATGRSRPFWVIGKVVRILVLAAADLLLGHTLLTLGL